MEITAHRHSCTDALHASRFSFLSKTNESRKRREAAWKEILGGMETTELREYSGAAKYGAKDYSGGKVREQVYLFRSSEFLHHLLANLVAVDSTDHCNTAWSLSAGATNPKVLRGRRFNRSAILFRSDWEY
jgi:hypothetical protein